MQNNFSLEDVEAVKGTLLRALPNVQSSHRVEAIARGLGWKTNAALCAEPKDQTSARSVDDFAFTGYLRMHGFSDVPTDTLSEAILHSKFDAERIALMDVMSVNPY